MKTTLIFTRKVMPGRPVGPDSRFPALREPIGSQIRSELSESDGLFINYGMFQDSLPYTMQDDYDLTEKKEMSFTCAVLENDFLKAEFIPELGGRLWRLYDKVQKRDLLTNNPEFLPHNLAIRNAWFAGGIEYNCGRRGHDPNTCSPRFAAEIRTEEYGPVLRFYDYARDRKTPFQTDFFMLDDKPFLFMRGRICNPQREVVPMYWWSNIAVEMTHGCRVVVPAMETYANHYDAGNHFITKTAMPDGEGFDQTYPENFPIARDHFYDIPAGTRKYESVFNRDGTGFLHLSTKRLQGRKLFVWGQQPGGKNWQRKLLGKGAGEYLEIQGGLAKTQQECLPMPPWTAWEWLEACGGVKASPEDIFSSWDRAVGTVTAIADRMLPEETMDQMLKDTHDTVALREGELKFRGLGFGALEELRSGKKLSPHLDFGKPEEVQSGWVCLLNEGKFNDDFPASFQVDPDWIELVRKAPESWKKDYHLALYAFRLQDAERAEEFSEKALERSRNAWTLHARANVRMRFGGDTDSAMRELFEAATLPEADAYLIKETFKVLLIHRKYRLILDLYQRIGKRDRMRPNVRVHYAAALLHTGKPQEALDFLMAEGALELPDVREGESILTKLYFDIQHALGKTDEEIIVPPGMDYRTGF